MKNRIILTGFVAFLLFLTSFSNVGAALQPIPAPRSPFNYGDKYETDLFAGSANYSYPIKVPKGTNDLTPDVSLSYSSAGARDFSQRAGAGWQLSQDYVERDVNFTPTNPGDDKFRLHFKGGVYDLVYVASENRYHTKTESYLNIQKLTGGQNELSEYWQVITQDGTKYRLGYSAQSELMCNGRGYISTWNLDQVEDTHGNKIFYTYAENGGISYVSKIEYNNDKTRAVDIIYEANPYQRNVYIQGCSVSEVSRLKNIQVKITTGTILVRQYDLNYGPTSGTAQVLQSITEKAGDGTALPATTFTYKPEVKNWVTTPETWINNADIDVHLEKTDVVLVDMNGDGLLDIARTHQNGASSSWDVLLNQGNSWATTFIRWGNNIPEAYGINSNEMRLIDVNGDNLPDIVRSHGTDWMVWRNTGTSFNSTWEVWAHFGTSDIDMNTNRATLVDVTGDGLPDIVRTWWNAQQQWEVYRNLGNSWSTTPEVWSYGSVGNQGLDALNVRLMDVNGDNLPDIIRTTYNGNNDNSTDTWYVYKNTGSGWNTSAETWINNAPITAHLEMTYLTFYITLQDVNGDGLVDIVKSLEGPNRWMVLLNSGNSWSSQWEEWVNPAGPILASLQGNTHMADVTGDGLPDIIRTNYNGGFDTWNVYKNNGKASNLLASVKTAQGGTISFDYRASTAFSNNGFDGIPDLPFNLWLVEKKTENNGMTGAHLTNGVTTYSYKDGFYKWQDKEFRGFGTIDENLPDTSKKKYVFNQDDALKGLLSEVQTRDSSSNPYAETENTWSSSQANGVFTVNLASEKNYAYDGSAGNPKITQVDYTYDGSGNVTKKSELGDTGATGDERFTYYEYTTNPSLWILNTLKHTYFHAADDGTKMSESWYYYDGHAGLDDAPTKADATKEIKWSDTAGLTSPTTIYEYDSFGNKTKVADANNHATQYAYDVTGTYPISTTNAKNQISTMSYALGTGNLLSKTDPNGFVTSYVYDVFGRITKEIKPYDTSEFPTTSYQYFNDGTAPEGTLVSKREVSGAAGTLDVYAWADGLGRKMQTRADAEDASKQIVTDTFYDTTGDIAKETVPHLDTLTTSYTAPVAGTRVTEMTYDPLGRVTLVKNPKGDISSTAYDHWKETNIDENGKIKRQYLNAYGKIVKVEEANGINTYATNYDYNSRDELVKITDALGNVDTITYDSLGRRKSQIDPDMGTWQYEYDGVDNLTKKTDNRGVITTMTYDELDRRTKVDYPTDTDVVYTYDGNGKIGTLTSLTNSGGTLTYSYDNRMRKIQEQRVVDGTTWTTQFAYDSLDRPMTRTNPDGQVVNYAYNSQGEVNSVNGILSNIDYSAQGKITKKDFANSVTTNYTYNTDDFRLNRIRAGSIFDSGYTYDKVGNVLSITDNLLGKTQNFGYDDLDRLTTAQETSGYNYGYEYNAIGNLTKFTNSGNPIDYTYGQNAGVHAMTSSTETAPTPIPTPTPTATPTPTPTVIPTATPTPTSVPTPTPTTGGIPQLLLNPGFESGNINWTATSGVITNNTGYPAKTGSWYAWLLGYGTTHTDTLAQTITIPSNATAASLSFFLRIGTAETTTTSAYDKLKVQIKNTSGTVLKTLVTYSNLNKSSTYSQKTFDILAYKGQTIQIYFTGTEDSSLSTSFLIDDAAVSVSQTTATPTPAPTSTPTPTTPPTPTPTAIPTSTPTPTSANTPTPTPAGQRSDLVITNVTLSPTNPTSGESFSAQVTVKNQGTSSTPAKYVGTAYYYDLTSTPTASTTYNGGSYSYFTLAAGQSKTITLSSLKLNGTGNHNLRLYVDVFNVITEGDETNNAYGPLTFSISQ